MCIVPCKRPVLAVMHHCQRSTRNLGLRPPNPWYPRTHRSLRCVAAPLTCCVALVNGGVITQSLAELLGEVVRLDSLVDARFEAHSMWVAYFEMLLTLVRRTWLLLLLLLLLLLRGWRS